MPDSLASIIAKTILMAVTSAINAYLMELAFNHLHENVPAVPTLGYITCYLVTFTIMSIGLSIATIGREMGDD